MGIKKPPNQAVRSQDKSAASKYICMALALFPENRSKTKDTHSVGSHEICHIETSAPDQQNYMGIYGAQVHAGSYVQDHSIGISDNFCPSGIRQLCISSIYCVYKRCTVRRDYDDPNRPRPPPPLCTRSSSRSSGKVPLAAPCRRGNCCPVCGRWRRGLSVSIITTRRAYEELDGDLQHQNTAARTEHRKH